MATARPAGPPSGWSPFLRGGSVYHFNTGLDGGGEVALHRYYAEAGMGYLFRRDRLVSFSAGYGQEDYHFSGITEPWNNIDSIRVGVFSRWTFHDKQSAFAAGSVRAYGARDARLSDAITAAVFGGASYRFSDRLALGPGLGVVGQLEDNPRYFPIVVVDWDITERLNLATGGGLAATAGPGLALSYRVSRHWQAGLVGRYERKRFRLSGRGMAPQGVGEDRNVSVAGSVSYVLYPGTQVSALMGVNLDGRIRVEDARGDTFYRKEYDSSVFSGLTFRARF
jgi:hypothetical protein